MTGRRVVMVGGFPPPVGGAAKNNAILFASLRDAGVDARKISVSADSLAHNGRGLGYHFQRLRRNIAGLGKAWRLGKSEAVLYVVPDAGWGAWYSLVHVKLAASRYGKVVLHHRSFRYIDRHSRPIALMSAVRPMTHVFLSPNMAEAYQRRYGLVDHLVASNARFVAEEAVTAPISRAGGSIRIGHLSNLCRDKGFFDVADAYTALRDSGMDAELHLAGPILEAESAARLEQLRRVHQERIHYHGNLSGVAKRDFYRGLDLFLFPTRFEQEASPNVVYEALAAAVPCLAFDRGCLPEMLSGDSGATCPRDSDFTAFVLDWIRGFAMDEPARMERARSIKRKMVEECERSRLQYADLMLLLGADSAAHVGQEF